MCVLEIKHVVLASKSLQTMEKTCRKIKFHLLLNSWAVKATLASQVIETQLYSLLPGQISKFTSKLYTIICWKSSRALCRMDHVNQLTTFPMSLGQSLPTRTRAGSRPAWCRPRWTRWSWWRPCRRLADSASGGRGRHSAGRRWRTKSLWRPCLKKREEFFFQFLILIFLN